MSHLNIRIQDGIPLEEFIRWEQRDAPGAGGLYLIELCVNRRICLKFGMSENIARRIKQHGQYDSELKVFAILKMINTSDLEGATWRECISNAEKMYMHLLQKLRGLDDEPMYKELVFLNEMPALRGRSLGVSPGDAFLRNANQTSLDTALTVMDILARDFSEAAGRLGSADFGPSDIKMHTCEYMWKRLPDLTEPRRVRRLMSARKASSIAKVFANMAQSVPPTSMASSSSGGLSQAEYARFPPQPHFNDSQIGKRVTKKIDLKPSERPLEFLNPLKPEYVSPSASLKWVRGREGTLSIKVVFPELPPAGVMEVMRGKRGKKEPRVTGKSKEIWYNVSSHGGWMRALALAQRHLAHPEQVGTSAQDEPGDVPVTVHEINLATQDYPTQVQSDSARKGLMDKLTRVSPKRRRSDAQTVLSSPGSSTKPTEVDTPTPPSRASQRNTLQESLSPTQIEGASQISILEADTALEDTLTQLEE